MDRDVYNQLLIDKAVRISRKEMIEERESSDVLKKHAYALTETPIWDDLCDKAKNGDWPGKTFRFKEELHRSKAELGLDFAIVNVDGEWVLFNEQACSFAARIMKNKYPNLPIRLRNGRADLAFKDELPIIAYRWQAISDDVRQKIIQEVSKEVS